MLLRDELEPPREQGRYDGLSVEEVAERGLVCAVSVLGLERVGRMLGDLGHKGVLDMGLGWKPERGDTPASLEAGRTDTGAPANTQAAPQLERQSEPELPATTG
jgi:hypothetical protein